MTTTKNLASSSSLQNPKVDQKLRLGLIIGGLTIMISLALFWLLGYDIEATRIGIDWDTWKNKILLLIDIPLFIFILIVWGVLTSRDLTSKGVDRSTKNKYLVRYLPLQLIANFGEAFGASIVILQVLIFADPMYAGLGFKTQSWMILLGLITVPLVGIFDYTTSNRTFTINFVGAIFLALSFDLWFQLSNVILEGPYYIYDENYELIINNPSIWLVVGILIASFSLSIDIWSGNLVGNWELATLTIQKMQGKSISRAKMTQELINLVVCITLSIIVYYGSSIPLFRDSQFEWSMVLGGYIIYGIIYPALFNLFIPMIDNLNSKFNYLPQV